MGNKLGCLEEWGSAQVGKSQETVSSSPVWLDLERKLRSLSACDTWVSMNQLCFCLYLDYRQFVSLVHLSSTQCYTLGLSKPHISGPSRGSLVEMLNIFYTDRVLNLCWRQKCFKRLNLLHRQAWSPKMSLTVLKLKWHFDWKCTKWQAQKSAGSWDIKAVPVQNRQFYLADIVL